MSGVGPGIRAVPGASFETTAIGFDSGLVGTLGVRVRDNVGNDAIARTTAGISEDTTVGTAAIYTVTLEAPLVAGQYTIIWDDGTSLAAEDLFVTYSTAASITPGGRDLCTLDDVQAYIPGYVVNDDADTDAILQELITAVSTQIHNDTNREIQPITSNPYDKTFDLSHFDACEHRVFVGDLANTTDLDVVITRQDGDAVATLSMTDEAIVAIPRNREEWQPYNYLWFPPAFADTPSLRADDIMVVTANWGFPTIPSDIRTACIKLVIVRYLRDVATGGTAFADAITDANFDLSSAFASAQDTIESYTFAVLA